MKFNENGSVNDEPETCLENMFMELNNCTFFIPVMMAFMMTLDNQKIT